MALEDKEKTFFIMHLGMLCYKVMPFDLKNAETTCQRMATTLLHDMMHQEVEVYMDNMIIKSKTRDGHIPVLRKFFQKIC